MMRTTTILVTQTCYKDIKSVLISNPNNVYGTKEPTSLYLYIREVFYLCPNQDASN